MKRSVGGGAHRGPVAIDRQRRTLRFVQGLLVVIAAGLLAFAALEWIRMRDFDAANPADAAGGPTKPPVSEVVVLTLLAIASAGAARALQGDGGVRIPTPARLEELAGRAEAVAVERAEAAAQHPPD